MSTLKDKQEFQADFAKSVLSLTSIAYLNIFCSLVISTLPKIIKHL